MKRLGHLLNESLKSNITFVDFIVSVYDLCLSLRRESHDISQMKYSIRWLIKEKVNKLRGFLFL